MVLIMIMFVSFVSPSSFSFYRKIKKKKKALDFFSVLGHLPRIRLLVISSSQFIIL